MTNQINTPEMAALLQQAKDGLATHQGQVVIQQIHIHQGDSESNQGLLTAGFRQTLTKYVFRPTGQILKWGTAPVWIPLGGLVREISTTPKRIGKAFVEPWQQDFQAIAEDHQEWKSLCQKDRDLITIQARSWLGIAVSFVIMAMTVEGYYKWVPILFLLGLVAVRRAWCPVRHVLGLKQGGWSEWSEHFTKTLQIVRHGGVVAYHQAEADKAIEATTAAVEAPVEPESPQPEPIFQPKAEEAQAWTGTVQLGEGQCSCHITAPSDWSASPTRFASISRKGDLETFAARDGYEVVGTWRETACGTKDHRPERNATE